MSKFVDDYLKWLKQNISEKTLQDCLEITTPFLDRHNDWLQIYVEENEDNIRITDDGYIIEDLKMSGCDITTPSRKKIIEKIINGFGVKISENNELYINTSMNQFPQSKHSLIQCMLSVNDLYISSKSNVFSIFTDEIKEFFDKQNVLYTPDVSFQGHTGYNHKFDFVVPKSKTKKETIIKTINNPSKDSVLYALFQWEDTIKLRDENNSQFMLFLNDNKKISSNIIESCRTYNSIPITWQKRNTALQYLNSVA